MRLARYRAPEIVLGSDDYTESIDAWSAGAVVGELAAGRPLFQAEAELEALVKMCEMLGGRGVCVTVLSPSCGELEGTGASPCAGERSTSWQIIRPKPSRKPRVPVSKVAHRKERMCCHWE